MKKWLYIAVSVLLAAGCAREKSVNENVAAKRYFDAWLQVNYPRTPATGKGIYIIKDTPLGIYVANFGGGSVEPTTGQFNFSASEAYIIRDGKGGRNAHRRHPGMAECHCRL